MGQKKITDLTAAGTLDGTEVMEAVQGGSSVKVTTQAIANLAGASFKVYTGLMTISSGGTVVSVIQLQNTIGDGSGDGTNDIQWSIAGTGVVGGTMSNGTPFTTNKTWSMVQQHADTPSAYIISMFPTDQNNIFINIVKNDATQSTTPDLTQVPFEIRTYS